MEVCNKNVLAMEWTSLVVEMFVVHTHPIHPSTVHECLTFLMCYHWHLLARWERPVIPIQEVKTKIHRALKHLTELRATWNWLQDTSVDVGPGDLLDVIQQTYARAENSACVFRHMYWLFCFLYPSALPSTRSQVNSSVMSEYQSFLYCF